MPLKGQKLSEETKRKISETKKTRGQKPYFFANNKGRKLTEEWKKKISESNKGKHSGQKTEEHKRKISETLKGHRISEETKKKISKIHKGRKFSEEHRRNLSISLREKYTGTLNNNWQGGKSFEPYTLDWTKTLRQSIRERDKYTCQLCEEKQGDKAHSVHHIDYNKKNCCPENLITLCRRCNSKVNFNRKCWTKHFYDRNKNTNN